MAPAALSTDVTAPIGTPGTNGRLFWLPRAKMTSPTFSVVAVVVGAPKTDPRDVLVPKGPAPTPVPTVTIYATPSESPTP